MFLPAGRNAVRYQTRRLPALKKTFSEIARKLSRVLELFAEANSGSTYRSSDNSHGQRTTSERTFIEEAFRNSERRFRSIWESSLEAMRLTDSRGTILAVNTAYCKLVNLGAQELLHHPFT